MAPRSRLFLAAVAATLASLAFAGSADAARPGIYEVWGSRADVAHHRVIRGGQIVLEWKAVEPARGRFDWSSLISQLNAYHAMHKAATVQINSTTDKPAWLWNVIARCGSTQGQAIPQYWDPLYLTIQRELLARLARALKGYPHRGTILLVRANPNAIGTELTAVPAGATCGPAGNGHRVATSFSKDRQQAYYRAIMGAYRSALAPAIHVALRTEVFTTDGAPTSWLGPRDAWIMGTASDIDPNPTRDTFDVAARRWDDAGRTRAYWEPISYAGKRNLVSWNYWRLLLELDKGVSYIAVYGNILKLGSQSEYHAAFAFANRYAGWQTRPGRAPGAFVALRQGSGRMAGNLDRFMRQIDPNTTSTPLDSGAGARMIGPATQRFGRYAREIRGGTARHAMYFRLNKRFRHSVRRHRVHVRVWYLDTGRGAFRLAWGRGGRHARVVHKRGTGRWQCVTVRVRHARFRHRLPHRSDIAVRAIGDSAVIFHMVEVRVRR
jgi:hypothetical protein